MTKKTEKKTEALLDEWGEHYQKHGEAILRLGGKVRVATCATGSAGYGCSVQIDAGANGVGVNLAMDVAGACQLHALLGQAIATAQAVDMQLAKRAADAVGGAA